MASACKEKYGKEWSESLIEATKKNFLENVAGMIKHIGSNPHCICWRMDKAKEVEPDIYEHLVHTYLKDEKNIKQFLVFSIEDDTYINFYDSIDALIDDGWAID